ncbi:MAG: thioredoxin domain-containing protein, partial [Thaumarchaeota archaeon]|nr:thioredoxin domain-containing protein [Nitrososphaerota archaeon]
DFLAAAENCIKFIEQKMVKEGELLHTYKDGHAKLRAYLDDYAFFVNALVDYFEVKPSKKYLDLAIHYANYLIEHFWDENEKGFFFTADNHEKLIIRTKNIYDLSLPSGNSVAAGALLRLYHITQEKKYLDASLKIMESLSTMAAENPFGFGQLLNVIYMYLKKPTEITIINNSNKELCSYIEKKFIPESILVSVGNKQVLEDLQQLPFFAGKGFVDSKTQVYICKDFTCSLPLESISEVEKLI